MRFGRTAEEKRELCARGFLPVYSVDTEEQAKALIVAACPTNIQGDYVAPELSQSQTLDNLKRFGDRLAELDERIHG